MKPTAQRRRDRRALLDNLLTRALRGRLSVIEAALLAEKVREEQRVCDETRARLADADRALARHREAADAAILEAEQRAEEAEAAATRSEQAAEQHRRALADALGRSAGTSWPELIEHAAEAHQWATSDAVADMLADRQRAEEAEHRAGRYRLAWLAARRDRRADRAAMAADLEASEASRRALADALDAPAETEWPQLVALARQRNQDAWANGKDCRSEHERARRLERELATAREERERALELAAARGDALAAHLAAAQPTAAEAAERLAQWAAAGPSAAQITERKHAPGPDAQ